MPDYFLEYYISKDSIYKLKYKNQVDDSLKIYNKVKLKSYSYRKPFKCLIIHLVSKWYNDIIGGHITIEFVLPHLETKHCQIRP